MRAANNIREGGANLGSTSAYTYLRGSQSISPLPNQSPIPLSANQRSDADQITISNEGRDAQAKSDLGGLIEQLKQKKEAALTPEQQKIIENFNPPDREVRAQEQAHLAVADNLAYVAGTEGVRYAAAGEVQIYTSSISKDSQATLQKDQQIEPATLTPAQISPRDHRMAAQVKAVATGALAELLQRTPTRLSDDGFAHRNIMYARQTESTLPMWVDIFA